jgi:hypothetical protein
VKGFCYITGQELDLAPAYWRVRIEELLERGGRRRIEHGETFGHDRAGRIVFEVYGRVSGPRHARVLTL